MKRKVAQIGPATLMVSLPSGWVKRCNIKKGEEIDIEERGKQLLISTTKPTLLHKTVINLENADERTVRWSISALHKSGYDQIEILYNDPVVPSILEELIKDLLTGFIITSQTKTSCILKSIIHEKQEEFDTTLRRAFLVTLSLSKDSLEACKTKKFNILKKIKNLEKTNNQLTNFCERLLNLFGYSNFKKNFFMYAILWNLEKVADEYKYLCNYLEESKKINPETLIFYEQVNDFLEQYYKLFYKFSLPKLNELYLQKKVLEAKVSEEYKDAPVVHYLLSIVEKVSDFSASFVGLYQDQ